MFKKLIDMKNKLVFINSTTSLDLNKVILSIGASPNFTFPPDFALYIEDKGDWWIERKPFAGREKNEEVRVIALGILEKGKEIFEEEQRILKERIENELS
jgi:hypothetical protein